VLVALSRLGLHLHRVGGKDDAGIDLQGHWRLPDSTEIPAIVQCKSLAKAPQPAVIRELEGSLKAAPGTLRKGLAILAARKEATKGVRDAMMKSAVPLAFVKVPMSKDMETEPVVEQCIWNAAAARELLTGLGITVRYDAEGEGEGIALTWKGKIVEQEIEDKAALAEAVETVEEDLKEAAQVLG
jgi:hypothetical protein